ncbi:leucine-rich repeat-containing protein 23 [Protopterus annectens]|uniref:leucine-rich repeat-containing protein 23 n=1 Tax=Protopterus annectens TaxID=7888 RepID=UPI001CFBBD68|nr:leucine-rich repeat-containing protein 23 [Protopterus annectens]
MSDSEEFEEEQANAADEETNESGAEQDHTEEDNKEHEEGEEEEEHKEKEEEEQPPQHPLTEDMLADGLSLLCKTGNGLAHAYVKLDLVDKGLTDINLLKAYIHLRIVDISSNQLRDLSPLNSLTQLLMLKADQNQLTSARLAEMPYLQMASFAHNQIIDTEGLGQPQLEALNLIGNRIKVVSGLNYGKLTNLHTLELRGNQLESTDGLYLPSLKKLYLAQNTIKHIEGLERLERLTILHLRDNQLEDLSGFSENMKALQYLNIRGNLISNTKIVKKLKCLPMLRALVLSENPCTDNEDYRVDILVALSTLERLDKDTVTEEEKEEVEELREKQRQEELDTEVVSDTYPEGGSIQTDD